MASGSDELDILTRPHAHIRAGRLILLDDNVEIVVAASRTKLQLGHE